MEFQGAGDRSEADLFHEEGNGSKKGIPFKGIESEPGGKSSGEQIWVEFPMEKEKGQTSVET